MTGTPVIPDNGPRDWKRYALQVGGSLAVLTLLFIFLPREQLLAALSGFSVDIWLAGVSVYLLLHLIGVAKWRMLMNAAGAELGFLQVARCYYMGLFGNVFLPSVIGGDVVRAGMAMSMSRSGSAVLSGSLVDRTIDSLGLALVAGAGALLIPTTLDAHGRSIFWGFTGVIAVLGSVLLIALFVLPAGRFPYRLRRMWVKFRKTFSLLLRRPDKMLLALLMVVVLQTSQVVMNFWLGRLALIHNATFFMWLLVWPLAKLSAMVPLTQGGIGLREAAQGALFLPFGVSMEKAVAAGLIFQAIVITGNLLGGLFSFLVGRFAGQTSQDLVEVRVPRSTSQYGVPGALIGGCVLFFVANTLTLAWGTGSVGSAWVDWMAILPGFEASFAGSCAGLAYGAVAGYLLNGMGRKMLGLNAG